MKPYKFVLIFFFFFFLFQERAAIQSNVDSKISNKTRNKEPPIHNAAARIGRYASQYRTSDRLWLNTIIDASRLRSRKIIEYITEPPCAGDSKLLD